MQQPTTSTRKKFLLWGAALVSFVTVFKIFKGSKKTNATSSDAGNGRVKMLTQDGKLVEIDKEMLASGGKKITNEELQQWIKNKSVNDKTN